MVCISLTVRGHDGGESGGEAEAEEAQKLAAEERLPSGDPAAHAPASYEDFEILYNELEAWRLQETNLNDAAPTTRRRAAALAVAPQGAALLQTIDRLRLQADDENRDKRIRSMLAGHGPRRSGGRCPTARWRRCTRRCARAPKC